MNLNLFYKADRVWRRKDNRYLYLYNMMPNWSVVLYDTDEDTIIYSQYFTRYNDAYNEYKRRKYEQ